MLNNLSHIALILDGNKRWAKKNNYSNLHGYTKGFENIKNLILYSLTRNIPNLTIFALSSENFKRKSLNLIYDIIYKNFSELLDDLVVNDNVKINIFGSKDNLPKKILNIFNNAEKISSTNSTLQINIAFNYGFKNELMNVIQKAKSIENSSFRSEEEIRKLFYLGSIPDPDLLIRTGGYQRLSNFIMYNLTYTEFFFTDTLWPEFSIEELKSIINKYKNIKRKYGL